MEKLKGVIPPMVTPFDENGDMYEKGVQSLVEFLAERVHGLFVCGTYGSGPLMTAAERKRVCEIAITASARKIPVIVHVGSIDTSTAVELAVHAEKAGARAVASLPPYYFSHTEENVREYFKAIVDAVSIPVYLYNNPKTVSFVTSPKFLAMLKNEVGISGIKDSSCDVTLFSNFRRACGEDFDAVVGTGSIFLPSVPLGAQAFIPGMGNVFPELMNGLWESCMAKDYDTAYGYHNTILFLQDAFKAVGPNLVCVQELLNLRGIDAGYPKTPYKPLPENKKKQLVEAVKTAGIEF